MIKPLNIQDSAAFTFLHALLDTDSVEFVCAGVTCAGVTCAGVTCADCQRFGLTPILDTFDFCQRHFPRRAEQWLLTNGYIEEILP